VTRLPGNAFDFTYTRVRSGKDYGKMVDRGYSRKAGIGRLVACLALLLKMMACRQAPSPLPSSPRSEQARGPAEARSSERYDLERDEERGGHTLKKHVRRTDEELRERLRHERNISAASTWTDRETAEVTVAEALRAERRRIESWMRRGYPRPNLALHYDAGHPVGRSLQRGAEQTVDCSTAVIVLRADGPDSLYVLTAYPEARE
jgi:hypothetical protein